MGEKKISFIETDKLGFIFCIFVIVLFSLYFVSAHQLEVERGVVIEGYSVIRDNSNQFKMFVEYINLENSTIELKKVNFYDLNNILFVKREIFNKAFFPSYDLFAKEQELRDKLTISENKNDKELLKEYSKLLLAINKSIFFKEFTFSTNEFSLIPEIDGDHIKLKVRVELEINGKIEFIEEEKDILISEPLPLPQNSLMLISTQNITNYSPFFNNSNFFDDPSQGSSGWFVGDQHVHTSYGWHLGEIFLISSTLNSMVNSAISAGLDWTLITDHSFAVTTRNFNDGTNECNNHTTSSFVCSYGQEMSVGDSWGFPICALENSHYLTYFSTYVDGRCGIGYCSCRNEQNVIDETNNVGGFGFIAHPYQGTDPFMNETTSFDWDNWFVTGYRGIEILSASDGVWEPDDTQSRDRWDELLRGETNPLDGFVVGIANSDAHRTGELGHAFTYCYLGSLTGTNIRNALRAGKCTLSNGPFLEFTVQGSSAKIGERASLLSGQNVLNIQARSNSQFGDISFINVIVDGVYVDTFSTPTGRTYIGQKTINLSPQNKYIRLEVFTANGQRALTNPIWLSVSSQSCQCSSWSSGVCGAGPCASDERLETRTCSPLGCDVETQCVFDPSCNDPGQGQLSNCNEPGYEQCIEYTYGDCDVSLAINRYSNINNIQWGMINGVNSPYVVGDYKIGWKGFNGANEVYYDINPNTCQYGGCSGNTIAREGIMATTSAPGLANHKLILAYDDTPNYACWVWFNSFYPHYTMYSGENRSIYVLNCYNHADCGQGYYCDKLGGWQSWQCRQSTGVGGSSCTEHWNCASGYCDKDGIGLADDNWCFTPVNTYFDGQEPTYCELSTNQGSSFCDERWVGDDLNYCSGISYYEEECGNICGPIDITNLFECTDSGCSCQESLCDGKRTGEPINTCSSQRTYFADKCTATAGGEDRDNVCRASTFSLSCTADIECDGVIAGTGFCSVDCRYSPPNNPPIITSTPITQGFVGLNYSYQVVAVDPENDTLSYSLLQSPFGMAINYSGRVSWVPNGTGVYEIRVEVSDGINNIEQRWNLTIVEMMNWSDDIRLVGGSYVSYRPSIAGDSQGNIHVVWQDNRVSGANYEIYYKKLDGNSNILIGDLRISNYLGHSTDPSVASDELGNIHIVWEDTRHEPNYITCYSNCNQEIYYKKLNGQGNVLVNEERITNQINSSLKPQISIGLNGSVNIVWADNRDGNYKVYYEKLDNNGNTLIDDLRLTNDSAASFLPLIKSDNEGNLHVIWYDYRDGARIFYKKLNQNGNVLIDDRRISSVSYYSYYPDFSIDNLGHIHVVWDSTVENLNREIFYKKLDNNGNTLIDDLRLTFDNSSSWNPSVASDSTGNVHVVWEDSRNGNLEIYYTKLDNNGNTLVDDLKLIFNSPIRNPSVLIGLNNSVHIVWDDYRNGDANVYYKRSPQFPPTPPIVTIFSPVNQTYSSTNVRLEVGANEGVSSWRYSLNGGSNVSFVPNVTLAAVEGGNSLVVYAEDFVGNVGSESVVFEVDTTPPTINVISPENKSYSTNRIIVEISANDSRLGSVWWFNGSQTIPYNGPAYHSFTEGENTIQVFANDTLGNYNVKNVSFRVVLPDLRFRGTPGLGQTIFFELNDTINPNTPYILALAFNNNIGIPLPDGRVVPLNADPLLDLSLFYPYAIGLNGNLGMLNATGRATAMFIIPNIEILRGMDLKAAFVTYDQNTSIISISNSATIRVQ